MGIVLLALGMALDDAFDDIKDEETCTNEELDAINEIDREFFTMNVFGLVGGILSVCICFGGLNSNVGRMCTLAHDTCCAWMGDVDLDFDCCCDTSSSSSSCDCDCGGGDC